MGKDDSFVTISNVLGLASFDMTGNA